MKKLPDGAYDFVKTEQKILEFWHSQNFFKAEYNPKTKKLDTPAELEKLIKKDRDNIWTLVCPPPNAYDRPHMGNLSGYPYMDLMGRYQRLFNKKRVLILPGKDHAGIEGETTLVKKLEKEGKRKSDYTREEFYELNFKLQEEFIKQILADEKITGLSADFDRNLYTLDKKAVGRVIQTFIEMYNEGLIYKGVRIVNWDTKAQSSLSDSQCKRANLKGKLYTVKYKLVNDKESKLQSEEQFIEVATSRPETILGDTALVVNPKDERYKNHIGSFAIVPIVNRKIPIISSRRVEKEFGTGVLKLTPAHSPDDYQIMLEWNEEQEKKKSSRKISYINIINKYAKLTGPIPEKYKGLKVLDARETIIKELDKIGYLIESKEIDQSVLISERTDTIIEPIMSSQWYINVQDLKKKIVQAVETGELQIYPKSATTKFTQFAINLRDWAISRNLWWGYRLPVWYAGKVEESIDQETGLVEQFITINGNKEKLDTNNPNHIKVQEKRPTVTNSKGEKIDWVQDDDILDTWFSSGQWPDIILSANNFPTKDLFPTDVLVSGYDLLIKWDLFMVLFGLYKHNRVPFKKLYLTGLVKGTDGQKMSKSKGNFVPIDDVVQNYGIDAFRMNCFYQNKAGASYSITPQTLKNFRNFNNKLWNASKFVINSVLDNIKLLTELGKENTQDDNIKSEIIRLESIEELKSFFKKYNLDVTKLENSKDDNALSYILEVINHIETLELSFKNKFESFKFGLLSSELYDSFWHYYCDIFIERVKESLKNKDADVKLTKIAVIVLLYGLVTYLRMLHPYIPFITEEIFQHIISSDVVISKTGSSKISNTNANISEEKIDIPYTVPLMFFYY